jgi:hypothetical protein
MAKILTFDQAVDLLKKEYGPDPQVTVNEDMLAEFVDNNWKKLTGMKNSEKDEEQEFSDEIMVLIEFLDLNYTDFCDAWGMQREGA